MTTALMTTRGGAPACSMPGDSYEPGWGRRPTNENSFNLFRETPLSSAEAVIILSGREETTTDVRKDYSCCFFLVFGTTRRDLVEEF